MASSSSSSKPAEKSKGSEKSSSSNWLTKIVKNIAFATVIFIILVFLLGEAYAFYAMRYGNGSATLLWLPIFVLMAVLAVKILD